MKNVSVYPTINMTIKDQVSKLEKYFKVSEDIQRNKHQWLISDSTNEIFINLSKKQIAFTYLDDNVEVLSKIKASINDLFRGMFIGVRISEEEMSYINCVNEKKIENLFNGDYLC